MKNLIAKVLEAMKGADNEKLARAANNLLKYAVKHPWASTLLSDRDAAVLDSIMKLAKKEDA